jgi:hypothetical protein
MTPLTLLSAYTKYTRFDTSQGVFPTCCIPIYSIADENDDYGLNSGSRPKRDKVNKDVKVGTSSIVLGPEAEAEAEAEPILAEPMAIGVAVVVEPLFLDERSDEVDVPQRCLCRR